MNKVENLPSLTPSFKISASQGVTTFKPLRPKAGLIIESPHSSLHDPENSYNYASDPAGTSPMTDKFVDILISGIINTYAVIINNVSRTHVDPNRKITCINLDQVSDPEKVTEVERDLFTNGTMWLVNMFGRNLLPYNHPGRFISSQEIEQRRAHWRHYHSNLAKGIETTYTYFGESLHLSMHSYPGEEMREWQRLEKYDVIIGNMNGKTSSSSILDIVATAFRRQGLRVLVNEIFLGQECIDQHSDPSHGKHSIQIEIDRGLYMNLKTFERLPDKNFSNLKHSLEKALDEISFAMNERRMHRIYREKYPAKPDQLDLAAE